MDDVANIQKEIQDFWREIVSEMNYALSDDCIKEMQARNVLKARYSKFRLSLQATIDAVKEFTKVQRPLMELSQNPFDVENLPQIPSNEQILLATKPMQYAIKGLNNSASVSSDENSSQQSKSSASFVQKNCSISVASAWDGTDNRIHNSDGNSIRDRPYLFTISRSNTSEEGTQFPIPFRCDNFRKSEKISHASQSSENHPEMHSSGHQSYLTGSSANSVVSSHSLTYAALSPAEEPKANIASFKIKENNHSRYFKMRFDPNREKREIRPMKNVSKTFKPFEQQKHLGIVIPAPDFSSDSSDDENELRQRRFNDTPNQNFHRKMSVIKPGLSSMYAKRSDLIPHRAPPSKQLINAKITWIASQHDFYVAFVNEQSKYSLLVRDIHEQNYESLIGRKVEEGEPCMVLKNGQFYRALLESSVKNMCHVFLVDFGGYLMISRREITPMLRQHSQLPMAAVHCAVFGALEVKLTAEAIDAFKKNFPIDSIFKLLFVHRRKDDVYEIQFYLQENMRHDAFLPLEAYFS